MSLIRRAILALALIAGIAPAMAQVPPPVPALPDTERRTSYSISGTTCACAVNFALYGDSTDYQNWVEVFINGTLVNFNDATFGWTITSPSGPIANLARPITNAVLTFTNAQTGTVQIVGARRPRRTSQFNEGTGVPTRNFNVVLSDIISQNREIWDKTNDMTGRGLFSQPGVTLGLLPQPSACASAFISFDGTGLIPLCQSSAPGSGNVIGAGSSVDGDFALFSGTTGRSLKTGHLQGVGGIFDTICSSSIGQAWVRLSSGWGCAALGFVNPVWWGATGDGSTNDAPAFQSALNAISSGGMMFVPPAASSYSIQSTLTSSAQNLRITCAGDSAAISKGQTTSDVLQFSGLQNIRVEHCKFVGGQSDSGGAFIDFTNTATNAGNYWIESVQILGGYDGVKFSGGQQTFVSNVLVDFNTHNFLTYGGSYVGNSFINNVQAYAIGSGVGVNTGTCISVQNSDGMFWSTILCSQFQNNISLAPGSGNVVRNAVWNNINADTNARAVGGSAISIDCTAGGVVECERFYLSNVIASGAKGHGFLFAGGTVFSCTACVALVNALDGFHFSSGTSNIRLTNWSAEGNSNPSNGGTTNTNDGINLSGSNSNVSITGGRGGLQSSASVANSQRYGINVAGSTYAGVQVINNNLLGNVTGTINNPASLNGSTNSVKDNVGYNPVGLTAGTSTGVSTSTITAGASPETHYITQSATFNAVAKIGATTICTVATATVPCVLELGPNESYTVTWVTTQPTYSKSVH